MDDAQPTPKPPLRWFRVLVLFVLLAAAYAGLMHYFLSQQQNMAIANVDVLEARLQNIENTIPLQESRIAALEQKLAAQPAAAATVTAMPAVEDSRITALEKEIATLKATPGGAAVGNEQLAQSIRLLSSFHRLSDKVIAGKPFAAELSSFEDLAGDETAKSTAITTLAPYADSGIPTFATLLASFDQAVETLTTAEATPPAGLGLWERFIYNLTHLVRVHRIDEEQTGNSLDAILGRAEAHLDREEIEATMTEIKSLPDNARSNFSAWLEEAQITTETPALVDQLEEDVMQKAFHTEATGTAKRPAQ